MNPSPGLFARIGFAALIVMANSPLRAGPLPKSQISGDAKWVVHLDMEQFAPSQTCRFLMGGKSGSKSFQSILNHYQTLLGVDPLKDISGLTLYGTEITGNRGTALISGAMNSRAITKQFSSYPQYATKTYGKLTLHSWLDKSTGRPLWACFQTTRMLILASDEGSVLNAVATIEGSRTNLTNAKTVALPMQTLRQGAFFTALSKGYAGSNTDPVKAMILKSTEAAVMQLSETKGIVDGTILLRAVSPDAATQIHQILNGLMVSASLTDSSSPVAKLAGMSDVSQDDRTVTLKLRGPASDVADILATTLLTP